MTLSSIFTVILQKIDNRGGEKLTVAYLMEAFEDRSLAFLLLIFALPMAMPLPVPPGINILLASPLILLTAQQMLGRRTPWLPHSICKRSLPQSFIKGALTKAIPKAASLEKFIKPRLEFIASPVGRRFVGLFGLIMALAVCVPIPLTNTVPSFGIALMSIGVLTRDGVITILGALLGLLWVAVLTGLIIFLGYEGYLAIKESLKAAL